MKLHAVVSPTRSRHCSHLLSLTVFLRFSPFHYPKASLKLFIFSFLHFFLLCILFCFKKFMFMFQILSAFIFIHFTILIVLYYLCNSFPFWLDFSTVFLCTYEHTPCKICFWYWESFFPLTLPDIHSDLSLY